MLTKDDIVAGVFDDVRQAEQAIADLYRAGFSIDKIDMVTRSQGETEGTPDFALQKNAADGTVTGAAAGAAVGALAAAAIATLAIPGFGLVLGSGLLASFIGGGVLLGAVRRLAGRHVHGPGDVGGRRPLLRAGRRTRGPNRGARPNAGSPRRGAPPSSIGTAPTSGNGRQRSDNPRFSQHFDQPKARVRGYFPTLARASGWFSDAPCLSHLSRLHLIRLTPGRRVSHNTRSHNPYSPAPIGGSVASKQARSAADRAPYVE